jgi:hypothetical protein
MAQVYSDPTRESDPHALPNIEVFHWTDDEAVAALADSDYGFDAEAGWYWWSCFPGCMPDSDPMGPFETEAEATADAAS